MTNGNNAPNLVILIHLYSRVFLTVIRQSSLSKKYTNERKKTCNSDQHKIKEIQSGFSIYICTPRQFHHRQRGPYVNAREWLLYLARQHSFFRVMAQDRASSQFKFQLLYDMCQYSILGRDSFKIAYKRNVKEMLF